MRSPHSLNVDSEEEASTSTVSSLNADSPTAQGQETLVLEGNDEIESVRNIRQNIIKNTKRTNRTNIIKLREDLATLKKKIEKKHDLEERKLHLLEKLKFDERKVVALERIAGINSP